MTMFCNLERKMGIVETDYSHRHRERFLRFQSNINKILGLDVNTKQYSHVIGTRAVNESYLERNEMPNALSVIGECDLSKQKIYATMHLGCFNLVAMYLANSGVKFVIPVTDNVYTGNVKKYMSSYDKVGSAGSFLEFVNAEDRRGLLRLIECIKNGYSLLFYIDGNSGIGGMERKDSKLHGVPFANTIFYVRKGLGFLSYKFNLNVQPVYTHMDEHATNSEIVFLPCIDRLSLSSCFELYEKQITENVWNVFEEPIIKWYDQWEAWLYADSYLKEELPLETEISKKEDGCFYVQNHKRFVPIIKQNIYYFYDKFCNRLVKMNQSLFDVLCRMSESGIKMTYKDLCQEVGSINLLDDALRCQLLVKI